MTEKYETLREGFFRHFNGGTDWILTDEEIEESAKRGREMHGEMLAWLDGLVIPQPEDEGA